MTTRIFLVEDHPVMREAYSNLLDLESDLELCGVEETAEAFLEVLQTTPCDLVLTDLSLPGMDGITLVARLQDERPELLTIVISAHEEPIYRERARQAGARAYLTKRDLAPQLAPTIRRVVAESAPPPSTEG